MTDPQRIVLGITGNIATGKSTVVRILKEFGAHHIDADLVYRELVEPGKPLLASLTRTFGEGIVAEDGSLDRRALGAIVFSDPEKLAQLDRITHPAVIAETDRRVETIRSGVIIIDAVKLIESGHADICDEVWLVTAPEELQIARLMRRNNLTDDEARQRVSAQSPLGPKIARADRIIENSGSLETLRATVEAAWHMLTTDRNPPQERDQSLTHDRQNETYRVEVYTDYACPYAWSAQRWLYQVREELGDRLQITWRAFPLEQVNSSSPDFNVWEQANDGKSSTLRSFQAAHAAQKQGDEAFRKFHAALFLRRHDEGRNLAGQRVLEKTAEEAGLDMEQFREDLKSDDVFAIIRDDFTRGREEFGVFGTPTIIFENGQGAYLQINFRQLPEDPVTFWYEFVDIVRDRPSVIEIKRPGGPQRG